MDKDVRPKALEGLPDARPAPIEAPRCPKLELDPASHRVRAGDQSIQLTGREFGILECMLSVPEGHIFTRRELLDAVWTNPEEASEHLVDMQITKLRTKLRKALGASCIETVWGRGFRIVQTEREG